MNKIKLSFALALASPRIHYSSVRRGSAKNGDGGGGGRSNIRDQKVDTVEDYSARGGDPYRWLEATIHLKSPPGSTRRTK
jgi:hypothetical protein